MGSHDLHGKRQDRKPKATVQNANQSSFSTRPVFVPPPQIKKEKREK